MSKFNRDHKRYIDAIMAGTTRRQLPGIEPATVRSVLQTAANKPMRSSKPQKELGADSLFGDASLQIDMLDFVKPSDLGIPDDLSIPEFLKR